jgi:hypothetical protein
MACLEYEIAYAGGRASLVHEIWRTSAAIRGISCSTSTHLSLNKDAPIPREERWSDLRKASSRRTVSPIRPDLIHDKDNFDRRTSADFKPIADVVELLNRARVIQHPPPGGARAGPAMQELICPVDPERPIGFGH